MADILKALLEKVGPVFEGANHQLRMDVVKFASEVPWLLQVVDLELQVRRNAIGS